MTDLLEQLRDLNPVDPQELEVPEPLRARVLAGPPAPPGRSTRSRLLVRGGVAVALAAAAGLAVVALDDPVSAPAPARPGLAARAVAQTTGGVVHWVTDQQTTANGHPLEHLRIEGWAAGTTSHVVVSKVRRGELTLRSDTRSADGRSRVYTAADNLVRTFRTGPARPMPLSYGDPFQAFRTAYDRGDLTKAGPNRFRVDLGRHIGPEDEPVYTLDPRTARPVSLIEATSTRDGARRYDTRLTMRFLRYERLPDTAGARARLQLLPHPDAGPSTASPLPSFAVLRDGPPASPAEQAQLRRIAGLGHPGPQGVELDLDGARQVAPGIVLIPAPGTVCVASFSATGVGLGCRTLKQARTSGVSAGVGGTTTTGTLVRTPITLAVPDGVRAVRARVRGGTRTTVPVRDGVATLPGESYGWQLLH